MGTVKIRADDDGWLELNQPIPGIGDTVRDRARLGSILKRSLAMFTDDAQQTIYSPIEPGDIMYIKPMPPGAPGVQVRQGEIIAIIETDEPVETDEPQEGQGEWA
jgi:hypothetical protein